MEPTDIPIPGQRGPRLVLDRLMQRPAGHLASGEVRIGDHLTPPAPPVTWDRKELRKEKGEKVFCAGAGARRAASSRRELRGRILPLAVRGGLQHYPGLHTASLLQYTLVITSHNGDMVSAFIVSCWASLSQYSATIKVSLLASYKICISAAALCV